MKTLFYPRLAWDGLRKNRRMVFPYLLTCICMIAIFYILSFLSTPKTIALLPRGGDIAHFVMILGSIVIAFFSLLFLYYTNSFLIRRRAAEFGLYNVLGMNKGNLAKIITFESLITSGIAVVFGLAVGIALSKLAEQGLIKMVGGTVNYSVRVEMRCVAYTVIFYLAIFALLWISSVIRVGRSSAVTLLKSEKAGEKPPKANWFLGILGVAILGTAYYIAVSIVNPVEALLRFFVAVIMVIVATYLLMIAGSVLLCRILQKNKKYYYDPRHFVSVSSMVYRMKRNGAGLASIAIISTMVLVMIASASCLMFGTKEMIENRFQGDINYTVRFYDSSLLNEKSMDAMKGIIIDYGQSHNFDIDPVLDIYYVEMSGMIEGNRLYFDITDEDLSSMSKLRYVYLIPLSLYNRQTGSDLTLDEGEAVAFVSNAGLSYDTLDLIIKDRVKTYRLLRTDEKNFDVGNYMEKMVPAIKLIVPDISEAA
ncbi:MAG: ABC transporter permease, partial [Lachnospiraceae bacterium]|nr:ABC transporter permease [Lachnospiraceae bacterium]